MTTKKPIARLIYELQERTKELNCLYEIEQILNKSEISFEEAVPDVLRVIPPGWQYPEITAVKISYMEKEFKSANYKNSHYSMREPIIVQEKKVGEIEVSYNLKMPPGKSSVFLEEEEKLLKTIADRLSHFILHQNLKTVFNNFQEVRGKNLAGEWRVVIDMIRKTDPNLFQSILRKLLHQLCYMGDADAKALLKESSFVGLQKDEQSHEEENRPIQRIQIKNYDEYINAILKLAGQRMSHKEILSKVQKWIQEDKSSALVKALETEGTSLMEIGEAIRKYYHLAPEKFELSPSTIKGLRVSLLRRFFTNDLNFISIAKEYVKLTDFYRLIDRMIFLPSSHGKLGGKSSGVFLASNILQRSEENTELLNDIKIPKTWYVTSDCVLGFMQYNNLEEVYEQKYKDIDEVRIEYPHIIQVFKNSKFPPDIVKGLSMALDDFGDRPIIVRSSSLLEDQLGAAFSGKYKSLFLANQGSKEQRLAALQDAIAEVWASTFGPDPIEYRTERGLLDFHEEMGIMIMEVVGNKVGKYFIPAYAGVAFSNNEFRWSPRIKREDGLVRIVPGIGTRAVDRVSDDYPVLAAPGQPNLRVNVTLEEQIKYAPKRMDAIDLETNQFKTILVEDIVKEFGFNYPGLEHIVSVYDGNMLRIPAGVQLDPEKDDLVVTFEGLFKKTNFLDRINTVLKSLQDKFKVPVDIEFASDGKDFYLLQCRPQSYSIKEKPAKIPHDIPQDLVLFSANKYISNGRVPDITHIVYVDPDKYAEIESIDRMKLVARAVGKLNKMLPKRKFILMGPGRWGSKGDIKLGVAVTYSEINNTAVLIEVAKNKAGYVPDLSFGTHFFQDLVEAQIRYLPLYPDDEGALYNEEFYRNSDNMFPKMLPELEELSDIIHVIDVYAETEGHHILRILMNADSDEALGFLAEPAGVSDSRNIDEAEEFSMVETEIEHWKWRMRMAEKMASYLDAKRFGVKGLYIFGSTKNATAGPESDIDIIAHVVPDEKTINELKLWFEGWSMCMSEMNYMKTGRKTKGLLDVHYVTDEDIRNRNSYAIKIHAVTNAAKPLEMKKEPLPLPAD